MIQTSRSETSIPYFLDAPPPLWVPPKRKNVIASLMSGIRTNFSHFSREQDEENSGQLDAYIRSSATHELQNFHGNDNNCYEAAANSDQLANDDIRNQPNSNLSAAPHDDIIDLAKTGYLTYDDNMKKKDDSYYPVINRQLSVSPYLSSNRKADLSSSNGRNIKISRKLSFNFIITILQSIFILYL